MADPMQMPRLDTYAQDLLRQSYQQTPISPENLALYGQGMMQQVPAPPQIESYAAPQQIQPDPRRLEYANLIEQRFNELAKAVGGMEELIATGTVDMARQRAQKDIEMRYGPPPVIQQQMQVQQIPGTNRVVVTGGGFTAPQIIETPQQQASAMQLAPVIGPDGQPIPGMGMMPSGEVKTFEPPTKATEAKAKAAAENMTLVSDVVSSVDNLLSDEAALEWAGGMTGAILGRVPGQTSGIRQRIEQLRDQIGLFGRKAIVGQGQGSISDSEQKMAKEALAQIVTEGTDEQLISSLKAVRQKFGGIMDRLQSDVSGTLNGAPIPRESPAPGQKQVVRDTWDGKMRTKAQ
jgi:hypothetical protein